MGKPITRLNPRIESSIQRTLIQEATQLLLAIAMLFPEKDIVKRGVKPYDYRKITVLCILRILLKKTYEGYEVEMRSDQRICSVLNMRILPGKSTIQRAMALLKMELLREFNYTLIKEIIKRKLNILVDASGIRIKGKSIWYCLRINRPISRRECDKVHIAVCRDTMLILNWLITEREKNDSPFFIRLLMPFKLLGVVLADAGYLARKNYQFVYDRNGSAFIPFKNNSTSKPRSNPAWKIAFNLWIVLPMIFKSIYNQRSKIECVFSALKKRWGDQLFAEKSYIRRREMAIRFICYNLKLILQIKYAGKHNLSLWVRAKR